MSAVRPPGFVRDADFRTGTSGLDFSKLDKPETGGPVELTKGGNPKPTRRR